MPAVESETIECPHCRTAVPAEPSRDNRHVLAACPRHGKTLVRLGAPPRSTTPPSPPVAIPPELVPPAPPGMVHAKDAVNRFIRCGCGCGGVAAVGNARGTQVNRAPSTAFVMAECDWGKRLLRSHEPVVIVDPPAVRPDSRPPYLRGSRS